MAIEKVDALYGHDRPDQLLDPTNKYELTRKRDIFSDLTNEGYNNVDVLKAKQAHKALEKSGKL